MTFIFRTLPILFFPFWCILRLRYLIQIWKRYKCLTISLIRLFLADLLTTSLPLLLLLSAIFLKNFPLIKYLSYQTYFALFGELEFELLWVVLNAVRGIICWGLYLRLIKLGNSDLASMLALCSSLHRTWSILDLVQPGCWQLQIAFSFHRVYPYMVLLVQFVNILFGDHIEFRHLEDLLLLLVVNWGCSEALGVFRVASKIFQLGIVSLIVGILRYPGAGHSTAYLICMVSNV